MSRVDVFFAEGFEEIEALTVVDLLRRAGIETDMVSVTKENYITGAHKISVKTDKTIEEVKFEEVDMIVLPGGMPGTLNLETCNKLSEQLVIFDHEKKLISAICAAPSILAHLGILKGRKACSHPSVENQLEEAGVEVTNASVEISDHITTSRGMGTAMDFGLAIVTRFSNEDVAKKIAQGIIYK